MYDVERWRKNPVALSIGDYNRDPDVYQKHDYDPFSDELPSFITGKASDEPEPEWWKKANEDHASRGRLSYQEYYFKSLIKSRKHGNYMKGFVSLGRTHSEAHDGLMKALGWVGSDNILIDITFEQYKKLRQ